MGQLLRYYAAVVLTTLLLLPRFATAQMSDENEYKKYTAAIQKEVWAADLPAFSKNNTAAADTKSSAVVLARRIEINAVTSKKLKLNPLNVHVQKDLTYTNTIREMVKINDKAALDEYSEISYQQFARLSAYYTHAYTTTIVGARIIKPDGTVKVVNVDEAVLVKDEKNNKQRKLAITDLQVGDVIDYFIRVEELKNMYDGIDPQVFVLGDDKPILHYSVHCSFTDKYAVKYRAMNGAPEFKVKRNEDGMELDLEVKNIPSLPVSLWMSPYRQIPILRMYIMMGVKGSDTQSPGEIYTKFDIDKVKEDPRNEFRVADKTIYAGWYMGRARDMYEQYNKQHKSKMPKDSLPYFAYYATRFLVYYRVTGTDKMMVGQDRITGRVNTAWFDYTLSSVMREFDLPRSYVLATSKYRPRQDEVMFGSDYTYMLTAGTGQPIMMTNSGIFAHCGYVPSEYEGQKAPTLNPERLKAGRTHDDEVEITIPESKAADNIRLEKMVISLQDDHRLALVTRTTTLKGHMRIDGQNSLLLYEDAYEAERQALGLPKTFMEEYGDGRRNKTFGEEYKNAFEKERKEQKDQFKAEITEQFDLEPKEVRSYQINKMGLRHTDPDFVYSTQFVIDGWVKKAGNNYILDAGKLIGGQLQLKPEQRNRQVDIYMPFARSFEYNIELQIPAGYQLEGVAQLNQQVDNECGSFIVTARQAENKLLMTVKKVYKHNFEPVAKWPALLQMLDAATDFGSKKLLLKKA